MFGTLTWNAIALLGVLAAYLSLRRGSWRGLVACAVGLLLAHVLHRDLVVDDAFVTMRYARNLLEGHGLVFNPGERVEGFSSPFWALGLTAAGALGLDMVLAARLAGVVSAVAALLLLARWSHRLHPRAPWCAAAAPLLLALHPAFATWAGAGLETPLFALLVLAAAEAHAAGRVGRSGWLAAASVLVRPEGAVLAPLVLAGAALGGQGDLRRRAMQGLVPSLAAAAAILAARYAYYGTLLPNTFHAKVRWGPQVVLEGAEYVLRFAVLHGGLLLWVLPLAALYWRRSQLAVAGTVAGGFVVATIGLGGDGLPAFRFLVPALPLLVLLVQEGAVALAGRAGWRPAVVAAGFAVVALQTSNAYTTWAHDRQVMRDFVTIGRWLGERVDADDRVAVSAIGAIGYHCRAHIVDRLGLTDPVTARRPARGGAGHARFDAGRVLAQEPTILTVDWNGLYADAPRDPERDAVEGTLMLRFDGPEIVAAPEFGRDYVGRSVALRAGGHFVYFVRRDAPPDLALGGSP